MTDHTPTPDERQRAWDYIRSNHSDAHSMRFEGKCHSCKQQSLWSFADKFTKERTNRDGVVEEAVGYICLSCKWGNAGSRPVESDELEGDE